MQIDYDPVKNQINLEKHGIAFDAVFSFEFDTAVQERDDRQDYGEVRIRSLGFISQRLYRLVFTVRGDVIRVISLRKANNQEKKILCISKLNLAERYT